MTRETRKARREAKKDRIHRRKEEKKAEKREKKEAKKARIARRHQEKERRKEERKLDRKERKAEKRGYGADSKACCMQSAKDNTEVRSIKGAICDPDWRSLTSKQCPGYMSTICQGSDTWDTVACQNWCTAYPEQCADKKRDYCSKADPFTEPNCVKFCSDPANKSICDTWKKTQCDTKDKVRQDDTCQKWCAENNSLCLNSVQQVCNKDTIFTDPMCKKFCAKQNADGTLVNSAWCDASKAEFCNAPENVGSAECMTWCMQNFGKCDDGFSQYCKDNPDDPHCSCINSVVKDFNPVCVDAQCSRTGYQTAPMLTAAKGGCYITQCNEIVNATNNSAGTSFEYSSMFNQQCQTVLNKTEGKTTTVKSNKTGNVQEVNTDDEAESSVEISEDELDFPEDDTATETDTDASETETDTDASETEADTDASETETDTDASETGTETDASDTDTDASESETKNDASDSDTKEDTSFSTLVNYFKGDTDEKTKKDNSATVGIVIVVTLLILVMVLMYFKYSRRQSGVILRQAV